MAEFAQVIGSGVKRVLTTSFFLGDEDKARLPGTTITVAPHKNGRPGWKVAGYWDMCDEGVLHLLDVTIPTPEGMTVAVLSPGYACFANGCAYAETDGDCPECGEPMGRVDTLWVYRCDCGGFTFVNAAVASEERDDDHPNPVMCLDCGKETGLHAPA